MKKQSINNDEKQAELIKYRDLVVATIDYLLDNKIMQIKTTDFDSSEYYKQLKEQAQEHFIKGKLARLKQWFRDLTEPQIESRDLKFSKYLSDRTNYNLDIFKSYFNRVDKIIAKGKITTDNQFYDITIMIDQLCQAKPVDNEKMKILNKIINEYEQRKSRQARKPTA